MEKTEINGFVGVGDYVIDGMLSVCWLGINREIRITEEGGKVKLDGLFRGKNGGVRIEIDGADFSIVEDMTGIRWICCGYIGGDDMLHISMDRYDNYNRYVWNEVSGIFVEDEGDVMYSNDHRELMFNIRKVR